MITVQAAPVTQGGAITIPIQEPDICPLCNHAVHPILVSALYESLYFENQGPHPNDLQVVFRCPRSECHRLFIVRFKRSGNLTQSLQDPTSWQLEAIEPKAFTPRQFQPEIGRTSQSFVEIYGQAAKADADGLYQLCGPGYGKALEFLVKDYVKTLPENKGKEGVIDNCQLGSCIFQFVKDPGIKSCAKRAAWLRNDETHYVRKWLDKDVSDLKKLIDLTVHWISMEILTRELEQSMPEPGSHQVAGR